MEPAPAHEPPPKLAEVPPLPPRIETRPAGAPTAPEKAPAPKPEEPAPAPKRLLEPVAPPALHGKPWAANVGWILATIGFGVAIYSLSWERSHFPDSFAPAGARGLYLGAAVAFLGFVLGFVFCFVPWKRPHPIPTAAPPAFWNEQAMEVRELARSSQIASWLGVGLFLLGLILETYVFWQGSTAGPDVANFALGGVDQPYEVWEAAFGLLALLGIGVWVAYGTRAAAYRNGLYAFIAAAQPHPDPRVPMGSMGASLSVVLPAGVRMEDVVALMKKVDTLLATLPDDTVAQFSKTPEAETYLKLLSGK